MDRPTPDDASPGAAALQPADAAAKPTHPAVFATHRLEVGGGHTLTVEEVGNPDGLPAVFLHGGPGSGCHAGHRALFDGSRDRAVLFDQRGAGRSTPRGSLVANTTHHLVADIECIRERLGIARWLVVGGSWGATLALAYAERHPERVTGLVLRSVFLGTRREVEWAFLDGPRTFRPELLAAFLDLLTPEERRDPLAAYWRRMADPDRAVHAPAAWRWHDVEGILSTLAPSKTLPRDASAIEGLPATPFVEAHYLQHDCFLEPDELVARADRLAGIPGRIVQGRYDLLCPPSSAARLTAAWPDARTEIVERAGHLISEPDIQAAVVKAINELQV